MNTNLYLLCSTAAAIGFFHTLLGPDHYLPFIAMSRARQWSARKTIALTALCGVGHVLSSVAIGIGGIFLGASLFSLEAIESFRGSVAGWLMIAFGLIYLTWGIRQAIRNKPHTHWHVHGDGTVHTHEHTHAASHLHVHKKEMASVSGEHPQHDEDAMSPEIQRKDSVTPWVLFTIFLFGPCESLIPVLMYPALQGSYWAVALVTAIFGVVTIATMVTVVALSRFGMDSIYADSHQIKKLARYSHAIAGGVILACGTAVKMGL